MAARPRPTPRQARQLAVLREQRAVELRLLGYTYAQVAAALLPCHQHPASPANPGGGDPSCRSCQLMYADASGAKRAIDRALADQYDLGAESRAELSRHHLAQIDLLLKPAMRKAMGGDWEACRAATRLLDRRARHLGLDAPRRHVVTGELDAEIAALMDQLREQGAEHVVAE